MRIHKWLAMTLREAVHGRTVAAEIDEEMRFHLAMETEQNVRAGLSPQDAHRDAMLAFGGVLRHQEGMRDEQPARRFERILLDVRFALRMLRKTPGFTVAAVLTLAVGIGGNTAVFSAVNGVLLRPLPYPEPDRLMTIAHTTRGGDLPAKITSSSATWVAYAPAKSFVSTALYETGKVTLTGRDVPERVPVAYATQSLFGVLGVAPQLGRPFTPEEDRPGIPMVVVLSYGLWQRWFGGDAGAVGRALLIDGRPSIVVGVMPRGFAFPSEDVELWIPMQVDLHDLGGFHTPSIARLRPLVSPAAAQRELAALLPRVSAITDFLSPAVLESSGIRPDVHPYADDVVGPVRRALWTLWATVAIVLLIACVNVASLLAVRAESRQGELSLRSALGAGRGRLRAQSITESTVLVGLGGALGIVMAQAALLMLRRLGAGVLPRLDAVHIDGVVLALTVVLAAAAALLFGFVPLARGPGGAGLVFGLGVRDGTSGAGQLRMRHTLVVAQVAMAALLLVACGLMIRTARNLSHVEMGFQPDHVLTFRIALPAATYSTADKVARFHNEMLARIRQLPGVVAAGATSDLPLTGTAAPGDPLRTDRVAGDVNKLPPVAEMRAATPGYFEAMGIPLYAGRSLRDDDSELHSGAVVVTAAVVKTTMAGREPIGARVAHGLAGVRGERAWSDVVGVVGDVRGLSLEDAPIGAVYYPMMNRPGVEMEWLSRSMAYAVRVRIEPVAMLPAIRAIAHELDSSLPLAEPRTMRSIVDLASSKTRFAMMGLVIAAVAGLFLGAIGLYGMLAYSTAQRTREIGVRIALGATPGAMRTSVLRQGLVLCGAGLALGLMASIALHVAIRPLLYQVSSTDPLTFAAVAVVLMLVGTSASWVPARRASRLDPARALRSN